MSEQLPDEDLLMRYLDDELSLAEKAAFEGRITADARLRSRMQEMTFAKNAVIHHGIRESVTSVRRSFEQSGTKQTGKLFSIKNLVRYSAVAASIIIIVVAATLFSGGSPSAETIYEETYVSYTLDNARASGDKLSPIESVYQDKDYARVIDLGKGKKITIKEQLLLGISYLESNELPSAINIFKGLREQTSEPYHFDADFYLALAYVKSKDYGNALDLLQKIKDEPGHPYHAQVTEKVVNAVKKLME